MDGLERFVFDRLADGDLSRQTEVVFRRLLHLSGKIREDGATDDWISWATGAAPAVKLGEYLFGADPSSTANRTSDAIRASIACTWQSHPEFRREWGKLASRLD